jgi:hypothetical protein
MIGATNACAEGAAIMNESAERKQRSERILAAEGVPFIAHLPMLEPVAQTRFRTTEETANRALCLAFVALMGESGDYALVQRLIGEWRVREHLTPDERRFVDTRSPSMHDRTQFSWRYEALWALVWSLGFVGDLGRPDHIVDVPALVTLILDHGPDGFRANAQLRDSGEILDALDLTYRYHWAIVDARLKGEESPAGLDGGVVMERHYALNWLTCYDDQDWDDVSTDT